MTELLQHIINAFILGSTYALLGIGLTLIFGIMRVVNFAHGELYSFGAYFVYLVAALLGLNFFVALLAAIVAGCLLGALLELVLLRPMRGADIDTTMPLVIGPFSVSWLSLFVLCAALLLIALSYLLVNRTKLGKAMRATFQDRDAAS